MALSHKKEYDNALGEFQGVLQKREKILKADHPDTLVARYEIAEVFFRKGEHNDAYKRFEDVLKKRKEILGADHPDTLATEYRIAMLLETQKEHEEALKRLQDTAEGRRTLLRSKDLYGDRAFLSIELEIAMLLKIQKKYDEALEKLQGTKRGIEALLRSKDPYGDRAFLSIELEIAMLLKIQKKYDEALKQLRDMERERRRYLKCDEFYLSDLILLFIEYEVAMVLLLKGNYTIAFQKFEKVLNKMKQNLEYGPLSVHEREQLSGLQNKLEVLKQNELVKLVKEVLQLNSEKYHALPPKEQKCKGRRVKNKRDISEMLCVDSRDEEDVTKEENEINNKVLSRHEEIKSVATYDANKNDLLSNAWQSLNRIKTLLLMSQKSEVSIELQKKAYYNALIDVGALIYDHKNHVHGDYLSKLESRVQGNQLFSIAHDLYYLSKSEDNVDQDKLYSDQIKSKIGSYGYIEGEDDAIYNEFNIIDIKGYFSDSNIEGLYTETEAYDKEVITIHSTQVFANEVEVYVEVRDNNGNHQRVLIGDIASIQNTKNYILDEETSEIKLRVDDDKEYTTTQELEEGHVKHYLNIPGGHKVKIGNIISSFTGDIKEAIHSKLHKLELLASKKDVEEISNAEITDQDYNDIVDEIKQSLLQKRVSEGTFNQLKDHLDNLGEKVFAECISDVEKKLEGHGIKFDRNKFDSAKVNGAKGGKFFSFMGMFKKVCQTEKKVIN